MSEITDEALASVYSNLSSCSPLVRGLAERLRRVEDERNLEKRRYEVQCSNLAQIGYENFHTAGAAIDYLTKMVLDLSTENAALRERVKRDRLYFEKISLLATPPPNLPSASDEILDFAAPALNEIYETAQAALKEGE